MRIIELCTSSGWGGLELYALDVSKKFQQEGHDVLFVSKIGSMISQRAEDSDLTVQYLTPKFKVFPCLSAIKLAGLIDKYYCEILHVHWNNDLILAVLARNFSKSKPKLVFIRHMALTRHKRDVYHRFIYKNIDAYLVITRQLKLEAERFLPVDLNKIHLLYHGVKDFQPSDEEQCHDFLKKHGISGNAVKILLPGRIEHGKGQHILMEAVHMLAQQNLQVEVALLGHIMDQAYYDGVCTKLEEWGLTPHVHYLGFVENPVSIYNCFDIIVLTTYAETFGLVLVEGMKCGVAVIGTNAGGVPEIIEHGKTGLLFEPGNADELAACIRKLVEDTGLQSKLARAGQQFANTQFSERNHFEKLTNILTEI
ncbi:MAG: glycosyltransferase family 4 protein [Gammaproteobacteria bacterium]|nr:glycosyltransferase family 4 protein [Gammaproteobacteria bacterium]